MKRFLKTIAIFITIIYFSLPVNQLHAQSVEWAMNYGGYTTIGKDIVKDDAGNIFVTGYFSETVDFNPGINTDIHTSMGYNDVYLAKFDADGVLIWVNCFGGIDYDFGSSIALDSNNNVYVTGSFVDVVDFAPDTTVFELTSNGSMDVFVAKYDSNGVFVWVFGMGGFDYDEAQSITIDGDEMFITGYFQNSMDCNPDTLVSNVITSAGATDIFVAKYTLNGDFLWVNGSGSSGSDIGSFVTTNADGDVYVTGNFSGTVDIDPSGIAHNLVSAGLQDVFIAKYSSGGSFIWANAMGGSDSEFAIGLNVDVDGNILATGTFIGTADFDPGIGVENLNSNALEDIYVAKYTPNGNMIWAKSFGGIDWDHPGKIVSDNNANIYFCGSFFEEVDFNPDTAINNLLVNGMDDAFVCVLDSTGKYLGAMQFGGYDFDECYGIDVDSDGHIYITGLFGQTVDFDPSAGVLDLTATGIWDAFIVKLADVTLFAPAFQADAKGFTVYPNPSSGKFSLTAIAETEIEKIEIFDTKMQKVFEQSANAEQTMLVECNLPAGIYFLTITASNQNRNTRLIEIL